MNEVIPKRRKKPKLAKAKRVPTKIKQPVPQQKRKIQLTSEFEETEREVSALLENVSLQSEFNNNASPADCKSPSEKFFLGTLDEDTTKLHELNEDQESSDVSLEQPEDVVSKQSTENLTNTGRSQQPTLASTFILIDEGAMEDLVRIECVERRWEQEEFVFTPSLQVEGNLLSYPTEEKLHWNVCLLINRLHMEAKCRKEKVDVKILNLLKAQQQQTFFTDRLLYKSVCDFKFKPIFVEPSWDNLEIPCNKLLTIYIRDLRFTEHPEIQEEHRVVNNLELLYEHRVQRLKEMISEKLYADLQVERSVLNETLKSEENSSRFKSAESQQQKAVCIEQHMYKIKALRDKLYDEERTNKQLLKDILESWMKVKALRKQQGHQYTRLKLRLKIEDLSAVQLKQRQQLWSKRFDVDLNEIYREQLEEYYRAKRLWRGQRMAGEEISARPRKPDIEQISKALREEFTKCFPNPKEPRMEVVRTLDNDPGFVDQPGPRKLQSYCMRVFFDNQEVGETRCYRLERDLGVTVNEKMGVVLNRRLPKDIRIKLYKKSKVSSSQKIANIIVPLPLPSLTAEEPRSFTIQFSSHKQAISGFLRLELHSDQQIYSPEAVIKLFPPPKPRTTIPRSMVKEWYQRKLLELPGPSAAPVTKQSPAASCSDTEDDAANKAPSITCTFQEDLLRFCDVSELDENPRLKLLRSRYLKCDSRTKDLKCIPMLEHELEFEWECEEPVIDLGDWMDPVDVQKHEGKKYVRNLYEVIKNQCNRMSKVVAERDNLLLNDEPMSWGAFFNAIKLIFQPRLMASVPQGIPLSSSASSARSMDNVRSFRIICNITRATGIPVRITNPQETDSRDRGSPVSSNVFVLQNLKYSNVRPFVAISYKDKFCRTQTAEGSNPTWNEQLIVQFSGTLSELRDDFKICLYDEVVEHQWNDDSNLRNVDVFQRIQNNWLGEFRIPINAILTQQTIDAVFEVNTPKILIGYKRPSLDNVTSQAETNIMIEQFPEIKESVRLWCIISIEPAFELPSASTKCLECSELTELRAFVSDWCLEAQELYPKKFVDPLICTGDGKRVCITRVLQPLPCPVEESENLLDAACRFVSLLATPKSYDAFLYFKGIWLNNEIALETSWCSFKDVGVLLCNFLLHLGLKCWLVLGLASAYGECTFVLFSSDDNELFYIDACAGKRYGVKDVLCPLQAIKMVVSVDNLYLNIQSEIRVPMLNLNFNDSSCWLPCFNKRNPAPLGGFQVPGYRYKQAFDVSELRYNLERKIMKKISAWRTMRKTLWNRALQPRLVTILQAIEHSATFGSGSSYEELKYNNMLAAEFPNYKIYGFTLNYSYTHLNQISERIKTTGIHLNSNKSVEYSLAVHIHPYPNNVLSVWIFLISIVPLSEEYKTNQ